MTYHWYKFLKLRDNSSYTNFEVSLTFDNKTSGVDCNRMSYPGIDLENRKMNVNSSGLPLKERYELIELITAEILSQKYLRIDGKCYVNPLAIDYS